MLVAIACVPLASQDWTNSGGNPQRNGRSSAYGPLTARNVWTTGRPSLIGWQPVIAGSRVFVVRQTGFPPAGEPNGSPVVCMDVTTGTETWVVHVPYNAGDWTTHVLGTSDGKVYATRAGNGASVQARVYAYDEATGAQVWVSQDVVDAGAYDGCVFAGNGDLVIASFRTIWRLRAADGTTAWSTSRTGSVSGSCGAAVYGDAVYVADAVAGGHVLERFDLATGTFAYASPPMPGFTLQQTPMVGPDGTVYLNRTQNNPAVDFFYAFADVGNGFVEKWHVASQWTTNSEFAVGKDGSVYMLQPGEILTALDPATGAVRHTHPTPLGAANPRMVVDADGRLFVSNGGFTSGRLASFDPDLTLRWSVGVTNVNIGGPALAADGTLVIAGIGNDLRGYRSSSPFSGWAGGIAGPHGLPELRGRGTLTADNDVHLDLAFGPPSTLAALVLGAARLDLPLFTGRVVPRPDAVLGVALDGRGSTTVDFRFPRGVASGTALWFQSWIPDPGATFGVVASDGLRGLVP